MNQDDIIRLARQIGYPLVEYDGIPYIPPLLTTLLEATAEEEREALLDLVDSYAKNNADLKDAIRARSKQ